MRLRPPQALHAPGAQEGPGAMTREDGDTTGIK